MSFFVACLLCFLVLSDITDMFKKVLTKGRLGPGQMIACDLVKGGFEDNWTIKEQVAGMRPYGDWLKTHAKV